MYKNYIIVIVSLFMLAIGLQVWAQNSDIADVQQTAENTSVADQQLEQPENKVSDVMLVESGSIQDQNEDSSVKDVTPVSNTDTGSIETNPIGLVSETGSTVETGSIVDVSNGTSVVIPSTDQHDMNLVINESEQSVEQPVVIFANSRTGTEVINGQFVKKTEMYDLSPQAQDFVASILK